MECSFEERKQELESECMISDTLFSRSLERLSEFMKPFVAGMARNGQREYAATFVRGLCSDLERKNSESIAYHFQLERKQIQYFIGESSWNDEPVRAELARQVAAQLGTSDGVLVFDPSGFPKSGKESVGVARQWCGRLGKIDNCQVGVFMAYVSRYGHALIDGELYLPKEWTKDKPRMKKAGVPKSRQKHRTRHEICLELLDRHGPQMPHTWITGDDELGRPAEFRRELRRRNEQYLLAVPSNSTIVDLESDPPEYTGKGRRPVRPSARVDKWVADQPVSLWQQVDVRDAEKGPLVIELLKRHVATSRRSKGGSAEETLVIIRYRDRDQAVVKQDYYFSSAPVTTPHAEFGRVAKAEHRVEDCFDRGKGEAGMTDYEVRNWTGWQHHQTLSLVASWFLNVETRRAEKKDAGDDIQSGPEVHRIDHSSRVSMRFTPRRHPPHHQATRTKPTCPTLSLAQT